MTCIRELQQPGTPYTPVPLIQQIPRLIFYREGDPGDTHELLIALINDISEPIYRYSKAKWPQRSNVPL